MKTFLASAVGSATLLVAAAAGAANEHMVAGESADGTAWVPLAFAILVLGLVSWVRYAMGRPLEGIDE